MPETSPVHEDIKGLLAKNERRDHSAPVAARKKAMDYLARREHTRNELCQKLEKAGFDVNVALDTIELLRKEGLQSDRRFVDHFIRSRINQGKGPRLIRANLSQRGVRDPVIHEALTGVDADWDALARNARLKKFGEGKPREFKERARQMRFLQGRGFEPDQIQAAVGGDDE
jgi:regulatory protein